MPNRKVRAGQSINLRARFQDDLGVNVQASNVWLRIFSSEGDVDDPSTAVLASGNATYFGDGVFEYSFSVPGVGPDGIWYDQWYGNIPSQQLYANLEFEVGASGIVQSFQNQLYVNNVVEVTLNSGIRASDGGYLTEDYVFSFMTTTYPTYTNVRKVRLDYGGFLADLLDDTLQLSILEASLEADELTFSDQQNSKVFQHARREWVTCKSASILMMNLGNNTLQSKSLGDLSVSYDTNGLRDSMAKALDCMAKWEPQLMSGGYAKAQQNPQGVVKGEYDIDRPAVGRLWHNTSLDPTPAANTKAKWPSERRYKSIFSGKKRYW
jgi:hypothetical protein